MKFKAKISDALLLLATAIVIIISIVLWIFIMTNDQRFSQLNQSNNSSNRQQVKTRNAKSLYDLYMPTNSFGFKNGKLYHLYDSKNNLSFEFSKDLQKLKIKKIILHSSKQADYKEFLNNSNYIQLTYPDQITFDLFSNISTKNNHQFNRVFIPLDTNQMIFAGNDKNDHLYQLKIKNANFDRLRQFAKQAHYKTAVTLVRLKAGYVPFYNKREKWNVYSYLTNRQADSYFVARLLGTSGVSSKTSKKGSTTYSLNYYTRLRVPKNNENNNDYLYMHYEKNRYQTVTDRLLDSIYYVHRLGLTEQDLRFFDTNKSSIKYTNYVEGTPVFLNQHDVQINTNFTSDSITVAFNSTNLQIPIPFDGQTITLEPTSEIVQKLKNHGLKEDKIQEIVVGSKVEKDSTRDNLVNLVPTYYVKAYGEWKSVNEWLSLELHSYQEQVNEGSVN